MEKPSNLTRQEFNELASKIREHSVKDSHSMDYDYWEDAEGNWYSKCDGGFSQEIYYAGTRYFVKYRYVPGVSADCSISIWEFI